MLVAISMGKEKGAIAKKPKSLQRFDPLLFNPDWKTQERRCRMTFAENLFSDMGKACYDKGVTKQT